MSSLLCLVGSVTSSSPSFLGAQARKGQLGTSVRIRESAIHGNGTGISTVLPTIYP